WSSDVCSSDLVCAACGCQRLNHFTPDSSETFHESRFMEMTVDTAPAPKSSVIPMAIVAGLFFILGFATWLNGSLMPYLELVLTLTPVQASFILFTFYIAVVVFSIPSAWVIQIGRA